MPLSEVDSRDFFGATIGATIYYTHGVAPMPLTDTRIKAAKPTDKVYKIYDADGLYIEVPPTGSKRWRFKYRINGKEKRISLGIYPEIGLKDAREKRDEARKQVAAGRDPSVIKNKTAYAEKTFQHIADEWVALHRATWAPRHTETVEQRLRSYIYPELGNVPLKNITPIEVLSVIKAIEKRGALEAARRTLAICSQVFRYGVASALIPSDPCRDLRGALAPREEGHFPALVDRDGATAVMRAIHHYKGSAVVRLALRVQALTFVRPGELRWAKWPEFDVAGALWVIPAERMKMKREHWVPLSRQVLEILEELHEISGHREYLFPSMRARKDVPISENTLNAALKSLGFDGIHVAHGFRAMASSLLNEMGWRPDVIERQLSHVEENKVRAAYNRAEYITERRQMMQAWSDFLVGLASTSPQ